MHEEVIQGNKAYTVIAGIRNSARRMWPYVFLTALTIGLLLLPVREGFFFGSEGDWYSQHVGAAEALRQMMRETGSLIPPYVGIGGSSSIYDLAYYGLLRPDLLIACLLPGVGMKYIIACYAATTAVISVLLTYGWLRSQDVSIKGCLAGAVMFAASAAFFHAHHQIIFVNYMPFLILALAGVDRLINKQKGEVLAVSLCLVYLHSFFYAFACLVCCFLYYLYKCGKKEEKWLWARFLPHAAVAVIISVCMAGALLLPTAMDILSTEKDAGAFMDEPLQALNLSLDGLLYTPYGCGLTLIALFCLITALRRKETRLLSAALLLIVAVPAAAYVLNGFLYARAKILIPFLPLVVLISAEVMDAFFEKKERPSVWIAALCLLPAAVSKWQPLILLDGGILIIWAFLLQIEKLPDSWRKRICAFALLLPVCVSLGVNETAEKYLRADDDRQEHFSSGDITMFASDLRYRYDVLANNYVNSNLLADGKLNKTAMYSSINNQEYNRFYYDTMKNPISLRNRVVMMPNKNSFFNYFMGIRYLLTGEDNLPAGYSSVFKREGYVLAENSNVRPMVYGSYDLLSEKAFEKLGELPRLEALCSRTVADCPSTESFYSHMVRMRDTDWLETPLMKKKSGEVRLPKPLRGKLIVIGFDVAYNGWKDLTVEIEGVRNVLSGRGAPYPNENHQFTFVIPAEKLETLNLNLPEKKYEISKVTVYTMDFRHLGDEAIAVPVMDEHLDRGDGHVFSGEISMQKDGYLATSLPWKKGYEIVIDGQTRNVEKINTAFVGTKLEKGKHDVLIRYMPPGLVIGKNFSLAGVLGLIVMVLGEYILLRRKGKR